VDRTWPSANLELSILIGSDPISGTLQRGTDEPRSFCGWMELAATIEAARHPDGVIAADKTLGSDPGANWTAI
jgi:hypothetical protein